MAKVKILSGKAVGKEFTVEEEVVNIGRDPSNYIVLDETSVSRKHAQIRKQGGGFEIIDQGSTNGTFVNGKQISSCGLKDGDTIQLGEVRLGFLAEDTIVTAVPLKIKVSEPPPEIKDKAAFVRFGANSSEELGRLSAVQSQFGPFLMGKVVLPDQILNFNGIALKVTEIKPKSGGIIDSSTEVDVSVVTEKFEVPQEAKPVSPFKFGPPAPAVATSEKADWISRILAYLIDVAVCLGIWLIVFILAYIVRIFGVLALAIPAYFLMRDGIFPGQSPGKKALKIMVVKADTRQPISWLGSFLRQITMFIPIVQLIEVILIFVDPEGRRLGDRLANTIVVKAR